MCGYVYGRRNVHCFFLFLLVPFTVFIFHTAITFLDMPWSLKLKQNCWSNSLLWIATGLVVWEPNTLVEAALMSGVGPDSTFYQTQTVKIESNQKKSQSVWG
jgi:hypothetical protein